MLPSLFQESDSLRSIKKEIPHTEVVLHIYIFSLSSFLSKKKKKSEYTLSLTHLQPKKAYIT